MEKYFSLTGLGQRKQFWSRIQTISARSISELCVHWLDTFWGFQWISTTVLTPPYGYSSFKPPILTPQSLGIEHVGTRIPRSGPKILYEKIGRDYRPMSGWVTLTRGSGVRQGCWGGLLGPSHNYIPVTVAKGKGYANWLLDLKMRSVPSKPHGCEWRKGWF